MVLIIGGAYQGKRAFACDALGIVPNEIYTCTGGEIDFSYPCIDRIEVFAREHPDPIAYFEENREKWEHSVLILEDMFCGVVPMGAENRAWRQNAGRLAQYLAREATRVSRIFCGLEERLK